MGIREEHKAATRREIQRVTLDLFEASGAEATTVARIAERAGISERTFFRYFDSKESAAVPGQGELIDALVSKDLDRSLSSARILRELLDVCRQQFAHEVEQQEFLRISRLLLSEPGLHQLVVRQELHLVSVLSRSLLDRRLLDRMRSLQVAELVACTWRVAWQCMAQEEDAGRADPADLFEQAVANLAEITAQAGSARS